MKKKIVFVLPFLSGIGGINSSLVSLISEMDISKYEIFILVLSNVINNKMDNVTILKSPKLLEYALKDFSWSNNNFIDFLLHISVKIIKRVFGYKIILYSSSIFIDKKREFDYAISYTNDQYKPSFIGGSNYIVSKCLKATYKFAWIHNEPLKHGFSKANIRTAYTDFNAIVNVSQACKKQFDEIYPGFEYKSFVVNNIVNKDKLIYSIKDSINPYNKSFNLVSVIRIDNKQKRIDRIVSIVKEMKSKGYDFNWTIVGDGPDYSYYVKLVEELGINDIIRFIGRKSNPYSFIKYANASVLLSDYESYPMFLIESLALETPVICTNFQSASEIVENNITGLITDFDINSIIELFIRIFNNKVILNKLKNNLKNKETIRKYSSFDMLMEKFK